MVFFYWASSEHEILSNGAACEFYVILLFTYLFIFLIIYYLLIHLHEKWLVVICE